MDKKMNSQDLTRKVDGDSICLMTCPDHGTFETDENHGNECPKCYGQSDIVSTNPDMPWRGDSDE